MKKNFTPKLFGLALTAALALTTLTACGNSAGAAARPRLRRHRRPAIQADADGSVGTVLLSVNPEIEMDYDERRQRGGPDTPSTTTAGPSWPPTPATRASPAPPSSGSWWMRSTPAATSTPPSTATRKTSSSSWSGAPPIPRDQFLNDLAEAVRLVVEADQIGSRTVALDERRLRRRLRRQGLYQRRRPPRTSSPPSWAGTTSSLWRRTTTWTTGSTRWSSCWTAWSTSTR